MKEHNTYCDKTRDLLLLADSGEISDEQASELKKHMEQCPECKRYSDELDYIMTAGREALPDGRPSEATIRNILDKAGAETGTVVRFPSLWRYAAAAAAMIAFILGTYLALHTPAGGGNEADGYGVENVQIMVALASDGSVGELDDSETGAVDEDALRQLANTLLKLQGFTMEETETEAEDFTDLLLPTALQSRNTPVSPVGTSV